MIFFQRNKIKRRGLSLFAFKKLLRRKKLKKWLINRQAFELHKKLEKERLEAEKNRTIYAFLNRKKTQSIPKLSFLEHIKKQREHNRQMRQKSYDYWNDL